MRNNIFIIISLFLISSLAVNGRPRMIFECGRTFDWGIVKQGDSPLKAEIKIYNNGEDTLDIKRVKPMCGCTTAPLSKKTLAPGDSAVLKVTLNIEHFEGVVNKRINFTTNEPSEENYLELVANVYMPIKLFPSRYLNFSRMFVNTESTTKIVINNLSKKEIKITDLKVKPDELKVNIKTGDIIPRDSDFVLEAKVIPTLLGQFNCRLDISLDDPDLKNIIISGWGKVDPESDKKKDYNVEEDELDTTLLQKQPVTPIPVNPENTQIYKVQGGANVQIHQNPNLPVVPLTPDNQIKTESPVNRVPVQTLPVEGMELGQPVQMKPPEEEPKKEEPKK